MTPENKIQIFQTPEALANAGALFICELAKHAVAARGQFAIALSGGHTPEQLYTELSKPPFNEQMPWDRTYVFWGDERCVPADDERNNAHMARRQLLDHVGIPPSNIYPIPVELLPPAAAKAYEDSISKFFGDAPPRFDLILLGLGENGHTASLFPGNDVIHDDINIIRAVFVPEQQMFRITMTAHVINQARNILFLVEGAQKADILNTVLTAPYQPGKYPAQIIKPLDGNLYWFMDNKAAHLLSL